MNRTPIAPGTVIQIGLEAGGPVDVAIRTCESPGGSIVETAYGERMDARYVVALPDDVLHDEYLDEMLDVARLHHERATAETEALALLSERRRARRGGPRGALEYAIGRPVTDDEWRRFVEFDG